jgi:hypothetical protein
MAIGEKLDLPDPTPAECKRHLAKSSAMRQVVEKVGWQTAADVFVWAAQHRNGGMSWPAIRDQIGALLLHAKPRVIDMAADADRLIAERRFL